MKNREMSNYKHVLKERDYKGSMDDERNRRRDKERDSNSKHSSDGNSKHSSDGNSKHSHKSRRSNSPHRSSHHKKSPLKSKIGYSNSDHHRNRKHRETEINESYEELSRRKRKLESELRALDLEEAAQREAENKKARKEKSDKREVPEAKNKSSSRSDVNDKKSSKSKTLNVAVKIEKDKEQGHASRSSESDNNWGRPQEESKDLNKEKPNFEVSGKLAEETNTYNGIVIKYNEPSEARKPKRKWRLYPFKGDSDLPYIPIHRQSAYLFGRTRLIADIPIDHPSCSKQHAVLQYRLVPYKREDGTTGRRVRPYVIDLESSNGTFVNNNKIKPRCYVELVEKDVIKFGYSSREYVLLHEESKNDDEDDDVLETND